MQVFRINMSIARYWEGRTAAETTRMRWGDACMCVSSASGFFSHWFADACMIALPLPPVALLLSC